MASGIWCLVPIKRLDAAKQRLACVLAPEQRIELTRLMATDVIRAARAAKGLTGVAVVTPDAEVAVLARREGAIAFAEPQQGGLNAALDAAAAELSRLGATSILVMPCDVPLVTAEDIAAMIAGHGEIPSVTVARATADSGSNALALTPPGAIAFSFGENSFERHCLAARAAGIEPRTPLLPRLALDIDRPADLGTVLTQTSQTLTAAYLQGLGDGTFRTRLSHEA